MNQLFIVAGIDTDSGKTLATGLIARTLLMQKQSVMTAKLVQTGCTGIAADIQQHRSIMGIPVQDIDKQGLTCSYTFKKPCSPHLAAQLENCEIESSRILNNIAKLQEAYPWVIAECAGGLMVPLNNKTLQIDLLQQMKGKIILVASAKIGSINHTLLSIDALKHRNLPLAGIVYNTFDAPDKEIAADSRAIIQKAMLAAYPEAGFVELPPINALCSIWFDFSPIIGAVI